MDQVRSYQTPQDALYSSAQQRGGVAPVLPLTYPHFSNLKPDGAYIMDSDAPKMYQR